MTLKEALELLEINDGADKKAVKMAYRKLLPKYNPEEDEEGFLRLRQAYDMAMNQAENQAEEQVLNQVMSQTESQIMNQAMSQGESQVLNQVAVSEDGKNGLVEDSILGGNIWTPFSKAQETEEVLEEKSPEELCIEEVVASIHALYKNPSDRNDEKKWNELLGNGIFLNIDYGKKAKYAVLDCLQEKYALKSEIVKLIFNKLEIQESDMSLWEIFPEEYVLCLMNKLRDARDYMDLLLDKGNIEDEILACNGLRMLLKDMQSNEARENEVTEAELTGEIIKSLSPFVEERDNVLQMADALMEIYPNDFYCKILAIYLYEHFETEQKQNKIEKISREMMKLFISTYIEDDLFIGWHDEFLKSAYIGGTWAATIAFSKFGEHKLVSDYIFRNPSVLEVLEDEEDRMLVGAYMEIIIAKELIKRKEAMVHWRKAKELLDGIYKEDEKQKGILMLMMLVSTELYDHEMVARCYDVAQKAIPKNPYIYIWRFKMYYITGKPNEAKELFKKANRLGIKDYQLRIWELIFHREYDFVDGYDLQKSLEKGHVLLDEMLECGVCGELLADAFFVFGAMIYTDGRYGNAPEYFDRAKSIMEKPEYFFFEAMDCISNRKDNYARGLELFEQVYEMREIWDDGESNNPRFFCVFSSFRGTLLSMNETTDLCNLYALMGLCSEQIGEYFKAAEYYREAILINPSYVDVASGFVRVMYLLLEVECVDACDLEKYWKDFDESFEEFCSMKWLRARIAYELGDLERAKEIITPVSKIKLQGRSFSEGDWVTYSNYLLAKIYHDDNKDMFAVKYLRKVVDGRKMDFLYRLQDNLGMTWRILDETKELFIEMGYEEEAKLCE